MRSNGHRRASIAVTIIAGLVAPMASLSAAAAPAAPSVRLVAGSDEVTIVRRQHYPVPLNVGVFAAAVNGALEIRASRPDYDTPVSVERWIDGGATIEPWPAGTVTDWRGLTGFLRITVRKDNGRVVLDEYTDFCPAMYGGQRVDDAGPLTQTYPMYGCGGYTPFVLGNVWGIDEGWAVPAVGSDYYYYDSGYTPYLDAKDGHYNVEVTITPTYTDLLGISSTDRTVTVGFTVDTNRRCRRMCLRPAPRAPVTGEAPTHPFDHAPVISVPDPATLPDLIPLPAFAMGVGRRGRDGRDWLSFGANLWNAGPGNLVVEGYRQPGGDVMDAWQYFLTADGTITGKAPAGRLEYDTRDGHDHWHFRQFATYQLLDSNKQKVVRSKKEAFCLAPTDAIDTTRPNAVWIPYSVGLYSACGGPNALWTRENLDVGWGDTYYQGLPGQSFNITDLPNGRYFVAVIANPKDKLLESNTSNNVSLRRIFLRGTPGHRYVVVPSYHGID